MICVSIYDKDTDVNGPFLTISPRDNTYLEYNVNPITLRVVQDSGVDLSPDVDIQVNDLASGRKHFQNNSGKGDKFKVDVIIKEDDGVTGEKTVVETQMWEDVDIGSGLMNIIWNENKHYSSSWSVISVLDSWIKDMTPLNVVTRALDVPNGLYIITGNSSRKQTHSKRTVWSLEFTKFETFVHSSFSATNTGVTKALKNYNNALAKKKKAAEEKKKKEALAKKKKTAAYKFATKCDWKKVKYTKKKKVSECVKYLQQILNNKNGCKLTKDGWYGDTTKAQVKKFQTNNKKKYNLKPTGNLDLNTYLVLTGNAGQIGKTKTAKPSEPKYALPTANKNGIIDMTKYQG